jgi:hypothetical protein
MDSDCLLRSIILLLCSNVDKLYGVNGDDYTLMRRRNQRDARC